MHQHIAGIKMYGFSVAFNEGLQEFQCSTENIGFFLLLSCRAQRDRRNLLCVCFEENKFRIIRFFFAGFSHTHPNLELAKLFSYASFLCWCLEEVKVPVSLLSSWN